MQDSESVRAPSMGGPGQGVRTQQQGLLLARPAPCPQQAQAGGRSRRTGPTPNPDGFPSRVSHMCNRILLISIKNNSSENL